MLTIDTVFNVSREGYHLLANQNGNNGRALRRFLTREIDDGQVLQVFNGYGSDLCPAEMAEFTNIAEETRQISLVYLPASFVGASRTSADTMFSQIFNSYVLAIDVKTASVAELRKAVEAVVILSDSMHQFVSRRTRMSPAPADAQPLTAVPDCEMTTA